MNDQETELQKIELMGLNKKLKSLSLLMSKKPYWKIAHVEIEIMKIYNRESGRVIHPYKWKYDY
jgi:hypothetical protein